MASREQRLRYLSHHLSYELLMLRYAHARLGDTRHKLMWNAFLEAFAVHARNLQFFLTNDKDSRNYRAEDFNEHFRATKPPVQIKDKVSVYIVHPGTNRSEEAKDKFNLDRANRAMPWIEREFARFLEELPASDKKYWRPELADPLKYNPELDDATPTACTHPIFVTPDLTLQTHTSHTEVFVWTFPVVDK